MKRIIFLFLIISSVAEGQVKISEMPTYIGDPSGGWVPVVINNVNRKVDASRFAQNKIDSISVEGDTLWSWKNGIKNSFKKLPASTSGALVANTVEDLKTKTPSATHAVALGFNSPADGGLNEYMWDAFSSATPNGLDIVKPNGWVGSGNWIMLVRNGKVHGRQLGLYGDGRTTEVAAIKTAVELASSKDWVLDLTGMNLHLNGDSIVATKHLRFTSSDKNNSVIRGGKYIIPRAGITSDGVTYRDFTVAAIGISANPAKQHYPITQKWPVHIKNNAFKNNYRDVYEINNIANSDTTGTAAILTGEFSNNTIDSFGYASIQLDMPYENVSINENKWKGLSNPGAFNYVVQLGLDGNANIFKQRNLDISHNQLKDLMHTQDPSGTIYGFLVSGLNINFSFNQQDNVSAPSYVRGSNITAVYNKLYLYGQYSKYGLIIKDGRPEGHLTVDHNIIEGNYGSGVYVDAQYFKGDITNNTIKLVPFSSYVGDAGIRIIAGDNNWSQLNISGNNIINEQTNTSTSAVMISSSGKMGEVIMDGNWIDSYAAGINAKLINSTRRLVIRNSKFLRYRTTSSFGADVVEIDNNNFHHLTQQTNLYAVTTGLITRNKVRPDSSLVGSSPATLTRMFNIESDVATNNAEYWLIDNEVDQRKLTNMIRIEDSISKLYVLRDKILNGVASTSSAYVNSVTGAPLTMNLEVYGFINPYASRLFNSSTDNQTINITVRDSRINLDAFMAFTGTSQVYNNLTISGLDVPTNPNITVNFLNPDVTVEPGLNKRSLGTPAYTLISADILKGKSNVIEASLSGSVTITVPPASTANFPLGTQLKIFQAGNGAVTLAAGAGVTIVSPNGLSTSAINQYILLEKVTAPDGWRAVVLGGAGGTADLSNYVTTAKFDSATILLSGADFGKDADSQVVIKNPMTIDVRKYGAKGDSVTDNTTAFRSAIAAAKAQGGGVVFIPHGVFFTDSLYLPRRVSLVGSGVGTTRLILKNNSTAKMMLSLHNTDEARVMDITFDGNKQNQTDSINGLVIDTDAGTNVPGFPPGTGDPTNYNYQLIVERVYVRNFTGNGIVALHPAWVFAVRNYRVRDNDGWGVWNESTDSEFNDNGVSNNGLGGIYNRGANTRFVGGKVLWNGRDNPNGAGIYCYGGNRSQFIGMEIQESYYHGIVLDNTSDAVVQVVSDMNNTKRRPDSLQLGASIDSQDVNAVGYALKMIAAKNNSINIQITSGFEGAKFTQFGKYVDGNSTGNVFILNERKPMLGDYIQFPAKNTWLTWQDGLKIHSADADLTIGEDTSYYIITSSPTTTRTINLPDPATTLMKKLTIITRGSTANTFSWNLNMSVGSTTSTEITSVPPNSVITMERVDNGSGQWRITNIWSPLVSVTTNTAQTISGVKTFSATPLISTMTAKSIPFFGTGGLFSQDNTNFVWDNTNKRLGVGINTPAEVVHIYKNIASDLNPQLLLEDGLSTGYAQLALKSNTRRWHFGVGGGSETFFSVANKFFIYDQTGNAIRFSIATTGVPRFHALTGTGTRLGTLSSTGDVGSIANGSDGQIMKMVGGTPTWVDPNAVSGTSYTRDFYDTTFKVFTSTTNTTPQALIEYAVIDNTSGTMTLEVHGISSTGGFVAYKRFIRFKRVSGTLTLYAVNTPFTDDEDAAMSSCSIDIVSTAALTGEVQFNVTGISSLVEWKANVGVTYHFIAL